MATITEVLVPDIGGAENVEVIEILVKPGDAVDKDQSLITLETDKATMEVPAPSAGIIKELKVAEGSKVSEGSLILLLEAAADTSPEKVAAEIDVPPPSPVSTGAEKSPTEPKPDSSGSEAALQQAASPQADAVQAIDSQNDGAKSVKIDWQSAASSLPSSTPGTSLPHASPSIRKLARELDVPLGSVTATGPKGRITKEDVVNFVKKAVKNQSNQNQGQVFSGLAPWPEVDFSKFGTVERRELPRMRKISGANLHRNWVSIPHVTNHEDADITDLEAFRVQLNKENEKAGIKMTLLAFLMKACVSALKNFPEFNTSLDGEELIYKQYYHIGFAADTPKGLVVPVIRDADCKGILDIAREMNELAAKARAGKLSVDEMSGGCFSISSLGGIGGTYFTPIINAPEVAILGVSKARTQLIWNGAAAEPRLILPLSLSWDHRVVDGAMAGRFNAYLANVLADFRRVLL
ncbi:MAG: dihydrolipoyllysine-residue acetyltransferase [Porticoccaceae bacterium]